MNHDSVELSMPETQSKEEQSVPEHGEWVFVPTRTIMPSNSSTGLEEYEDHEQALEKRCTRSTAQGSDQGCPRPNSFDPQPIPDTYDSRKDSVCDVLQEAEDQRVLAKLCETWVDAGVLEVCARRILYTAKNFGTPLFGNTFAEGLRTAVVNARCIQDDVEHHPASIRNKRQGINIRDSKLPIVCHRPHSSNDGKCPDQPQEGVQQQSDPRES